MLVKGLRIRAAVHSLGLDSCRPPSAARCATQLGIFQNAYFGTAQTLSGVLQVVPVLIGVFAGGPLLAGELETGTFRFAWTQGCGRVRWAVSKLALLAVVLTAATAAFSLLFSWFYQPFFTLGFDGVLAPQLFDLRGVAFAAWTLAAFAAGAFAGAALRRTVPAMAASLAAWAGLDLATVLFLRKHYATPVTANILSLRTTGIPWIFSQWWDGPDGHPASESAIRTVLDQQGGGLANGHNRTALQWLAQHHYTQWASYQPESRFWHFQFIEGGWLLVLALLLGAATVWLVRRRAA
jgi:ABC-2 family transporter protein